jgi:hypothetical protein
MIEQPAYEKTYRAKDPGDCRSDGALCAVLGGLFPPRTGVSHVPCAPCRRTENVQPQNLQREAVPQSPLERTTASLPFSDPAPTSSTRPRNGTGTGRGTPPFFPSLGVWAFSPVSCRTRSHIHCGPTGSGNPFSADTRSNAPLTCPPILDQSHEGISV